MVAQLGDPGSRVPGRGCQGWIASCNPRALITSDRRWGTGTPTQYRRSASRARSTPRGGHHRGTCPGRRGRTGMPLRSARLLRAPRGVRLSRSRSLPGQRCTGVLRGRSPE